MADNVNTVRLNVLRETYSSVSNASKLLVCLTFWWNLLFGLQVYYAVWILIKFFFPQQGTKIDSECLIHPIQWWLVGQTCRVVYMWITSNILLISNTRTTRRWIQYSRWPSLFLVVTGYTWIVQDAALYTCKEGSISSQLLIISYYILMVEIAQAMLPFFICITVTPLLLCCMPLIIGYLNQISVHRPSEEQITQLSSCKFHRGMFPEEDSVCSICITNYEDDDDIRILPCDPDGRHHFHKNCIDQWLRLNDSCPVCRMSIIEHHNNNHEEDEELQQLLYDDDIYGYQADGNDIV